jgi:hypothetical protein
LAILISMNRIALSVLVAGALLVRTPEQGFAQTRSAPSFAQPVGFHLVATPAALAHPGRAGGIPRDPDQPNPALHFFTGAAIGAIAGGIVSGVALSKCVDDCMFGRPMVFVLVGGGALTGGLAGLVVYVLRYGGL